VYIDWVSVEGMNLTARSPVVTIFPPQFKVTASPTSIAGAQSVTFTASVNASINWTLSSWTWTPDSGTGGIAPNGCTVSEKTCTRTISKSGWIKATTTIGPYALSDSAHVSALPCLTNDSTLDDSRIRRKLSEAWNNSNSNAPGNQRQEQFGMRVILPDGRMVDTNLTNLPGATPCRAFDPQLFSPGSIGTIVVAWHTHPFKPATQGFGGAWIPAPPGEMLPVGPAGCATGPNAYALPGPSSDDKNHPYRQIIVDKTNAYWIDNPPTNFNQLANLVYKTKRRSKCDILTYN